MPPLPPAEAIPGMTPFMPPPPIAADSSAAAVQPEPAANVAPVSAGAAADQAAGTDIPPTEDAEPMPANVAPPPKPPRPPTGPAAPASVVPNPKPAPSWVASPMVTPNGAPARKCANSGADARPMNMHQDPVTLTVLIVSCTAP